VAWRHHQHCRAKWLSLNEQQGKVCIGPACRLGWPDLLDHPFVRETPAERLKREKALADAVELADNSRAWKVR